MRQCEPHRLIGWFFLPEEPSVRIPGILVWDPQHGATLELIGGFSPPPEYFPNPSGSGIVTNQIVGDVRSGTIYGETTTGQKLSIWDATRGTYSAGNVGNVHKEFWTSLWVAVGAHIPESNDSVVTKVILFLDELYYLSSVNPFYPPKWCKIDGIENPGEKQENGTFLMPYVLPVVGGYHAEVERGTTSRAEYTVNTSVTRPWISDATEAYPDLKLSMMSKYRRRGMTIELAAQSSFLLKRVDGEDGSVSQFVEDIAAALDLMRIATYGPCGVESIVIEIVDGANLHLLTRLGDGAAPDDLHENTSIIFTFEDVPLDEFLKTRERLIKYSQPDIYQAEYAWNVVSGLCGYTSQYVEEYVSQALAGAEGFHLWCLNGAKEMSLNARLQALHDMLPEKIQTRLGLNVENWASVAVWARNHVAHGGTKKKRLIEGNEVLMAVGRVVHLVTYLVLLEQLKVPDSAIQEALNNHPHLSASVGQIGLINQSSGTKTN